MKKKSFEEKVKSMTAAEIIQAMIRGLKAKHVEIDMGSFGKRRGGRCFGCAATNAVCEIAQLPIPVKGIFIKKNGEYPAEQLATVIGANLDFVEWFEDAIDDLRGGYINRYNSTAERLGIALITEPVSLYLPRLSTNNYLEGLPAYEKLAKAQPR